MPVVIASELPTNKNTSVTNAAEYLAAEVIARYLPQRFEHERPVIWIEHYPPFELGEKRGKSVEYSLVEFGSWTPRVRRVFGVDRIVLGEPEWRALSEEAVAELLGQPIDKEESAAR